VNVLGKASYPEKYGGIGMEITPLQGIFSKKRGNVPKV
jgi:hypothetical protein